MSARPVESWELVCDWPDCKSKGESGEYTIFVPGWDMQEVADDSDWLISVDGKQHYCRDHKAVWASDHENGEPFPEKPYLLIHDGDTDNPLDDDGRVTLIRVDAEEKTMDELTKATILFFAGFLMMLGIIVGVFMWRWGSI